MKVNLPVLACLSPAAAVASCFMSLEVYLSAEGMGELFSAAAALLTQKVLLPEVFTQVWMSPMGCIIRVTLHAVTSQILA